jgi:hypothetical protein
MTFFDDITNPQEPAKDPQPVIRFHSQAIPTTPLCHPDFVHYDASKTDVTRTWRRFGWTPIQREDV